MRGANARVSHYTMHFSQEETARRVKVLYRQEAYVSIESTMLKFAL